MKLKSTFFFFIFVFSIYNCGQIEHQKEEFHQLIKEEKDLLCLFESMKDSIDHDWDQVNMLLNAQAPKDMPAEEKNNMLNVRNADLIRMFESYNSMSTEVKLKLNDTEKRDQEMTSKIINLKKEINRIEKERITFFEKIMKKNGEKTLSELRELRHSTLKRDCH